MSSNGAVSASELTHVRGDIWLHRNTAAAYAQMAAAAAASGVSLSIYPWGGYRDLALQRAMRENPARYNVAPGVVLALPGKSTHGWGTAVDIAGGRAWVIRHGAAYGFSQPMPRTDPSHFQHNGVAPKPTPGGTGNTTPAPVDTRTDTDMILLYITDNADGNNKPGYWWVNPVTGKFIPLVASDANQAQANSWARASGGTRQCLRQDAANLVAGIQQTMAAATPAAGGGNVDTAALAAALLPQIVDALAPRFDAIHIPTKITGTLG